MAEDPKIAAKLVTEEVAMLRQVAEQHGGYLTDGRLPDLPDDGARTFVDFSLGARNNLTKSSARQQAELWRRTTKLYPRAVFVINLLGYAEDPREIWDIAEAAQYVRRWARYAGIQEPSDIKVNGCDGGLLINCGVFGDELRDQALSRHRSQYGAPVKQN